jgi:hypothetical protein
VATSSGQLHDALVHARSAAQVRERVGRVPSGANASASGGSSISAACTNDASSLCGSNPTVAYVAGVYYTHRMSKRLQVVLDEKEYREIQRIAQRHRMSVSEWVRWSLRRARRSEPTIALAQKLEVVRAAARHEYPTAPIDQMLREIESGYIGGGA